MILIFQFTLTEIIFTLLYLYCKINSSIVGLGKCMMSPRRQRVNLTSVVAIQWRWRIETISYSAFFTIEVINKIQSNR